ncbi:hypothetical protein LCGC14_2114970 [marine sediment metagenome]|uniref:Uncharacterized protein n=1 Tax=marine sediment metagenome TaxID=412755 RepID=A0A0F9E627_9ZZZZ
MNSKGIALTIVAAIFSTTSLLAQESSHCGHRKMDQTQGTEEQMNHEGHGMAADCSGLPGPGERQDDHLQHRDRQ